MGNQASFLYTIKKQTKQPRESNQLSSSFFIIVVVKHRSNRRDGQKLVAY